MLGGRKPLTRLEVGQAKKLMIRLKEGGYTNEQISELTRGAWAESTVKLYTRGVKVLDTSGKDQLASTILELVSKDSTLDDVKYVLSLVQNVENNEVSFDDVVSILAEHRKQGLRIKDTVSFQKQVTEANLTVQAVIDSLAFKEETEKLGYTRTMLESLVKITSRLGTPDHVLKALEAYASLEQLKKDLHDARSEMQRLQDDRNSLTREKSDLELKLKSIEDRKDQVQEALKTYDKLGRMGFTSKALRELEKASEVCGGPDKVLTAINLYGGLKDLQKSLDDTRAKMRDEEVRLKVAEAEYKTLQPVMTLCNELLYKYGYSTESIEKFHSLAKTIGKPYEVLRALAQYRDLKQLETDLDAVRTAKVSEETTLKELNNKVQELRATADELRKSIGKDVRSIQAAFERCVTDLTSRYGESLKMWGDLKAELGRYEKEIRLAKVISAVLLDPMVAKEFSAEYAERLVTVTYLLCKANGFNPKVKITEEIANKYGYGFRGKEIELLDLLKSSLKAWGEPAAG